jgi:hypothetical protein
LVEFSFILTTFFFHFKISKCSLKIYRFGLKIVKALIIQRL